MARLRNEGLRPHLLRDAGVTVTSIRIVNIRLPLRVVRDRRRFATNAMDLSDPATSRFRRRSQACLTRPVQTPSTLRCGPAMALCSSGQAMRLPTSLCRGDWTTPILERMREPARATVKPFTSRSLLTACLPVAPLAPTWMPCDVSRCGCLPPVAPFSRAV